MSKDESRWDAVVRNFSSQWFLIAQGSGIMSVILHQLDYQFNGLGIISVIVWLYTCFILLGSIVLYILRAYKYPRQLRTALRTDVTETSALSSISITFTTIIDMLTLVCVSAWGPSWSKGAYALLWVNIFLAAVACVGIPYIYIKMEQPGVRKITPVVLLPFIAALTAAAGGGVVCVFAEISPGLQVPVIIVSFILIGMALPVTLAYDALYLARLFDGYNMAPQMIYQTFILCGPLGQSSFALQILGSAAAASFSSYSKGVFLQANAGSIVNTAATLSALVAWGYGLFFWLYAIMATSQELLMQKGGLRATKFSLSCWSVIFPWGVFTISAVQFGKPTSLDSKAWAIWSTILATVMFILWLFFTVLTWWKVFTGELFGLHKGWKRIQSSNKEETPSETENHSNGHREGDV